MRFQYIGDGFDDPETTNVFGHEFKLNGAPVEVTDTLAVKKLSGNLSFAAIGGEPKVEIVKVEVDLPEKPKRGPKAKKPE